MNSQFFTFDGEQNKQIQTTGKKTKSHVKGYVFIIQYIFVYVKMCVRKLHCQ